MRRQRGILTAVLLAALGLLACAPAHIAVAQAQGRPLTLVALGDSLTAGHGLPDAAALPNVLQRALRAKGRAVAIVNAGVSGDTASAGLDRVDWSVPDNADGVILALGANDMLRGLDPALTRRALEGILARLRERKIPVMLAGMLAAPNLGAEYGARFNAIYPDLAREQDLVLYPFLLEGVATDRSLNQGDGIHPTARGVERMVEGLLPKVEEFLGRIGR